ncbi:SacI homology domain-containing protein [Geranomyces variabilis]|nr:SacI homology domain-containing protein [Geranomyces variabilis]
MEVSLRHRQTATTLGPDSAPAAPATLRGSWDAQTSTTSTAAAVPASPTASVTAAVAASPASPSVATRGAPLPARTARKLSVQLHQQQQQLRDLNFTHAAQPHLQQQSQQQNQQQQYQHSQKRNSVTGFGRPHVSSAFSIPVPPFSPSNVLLGVQQRRQTMVYESLNLYISSETFTFEPTYVDPTVRRETLVISREDGSLQLNAPPAATLRQEEVLPIFGLVGIIKLNAGDHIIVIDRRERMGKIGEHVIYKLTGHKIIPVRRSRLHLTEQQIQDDVNYVVMLDTLLGAGYFYFSNTFEITNTLQRQTVDANRASPLWQRADERFFWNRFMHKRLIDFGRTRPDDDLSNFILPIMCGFIAIKECTINTTRLTFALISRRSHHRAGTRYHSRGVDDNGNVSNYVETEQLVVTETGARAAYVQTRGSMPMYWTQTANIRYQPKLEILPNPKTAESFKKHFLQQIDKYGNQIVVNLINKHGYEQKLGEEFQRRITALGEPRIRYVHFDFHKECSKMRWDRISVLLDDIMNELAAQGYFNQSPTGAIEKRQTSVVRTNCMDCLDRTNVVQSVLARVSLTQQLRDLNVLPSTSRVEDAVDFESIFKHVWADNADEVSRQYSGTGALKTDFTRGGKRTRAGALQDFRNSAVRYFKNNFLDGARQDAFNLMLGVYEVDPRLASPFLNQEKPVRYLALPLGVIGSIFLIMMIFFGTPYSLSYRLTLTTLCMVVMVFCLRLIAKNGGDYVDLPRLAARIVSEQGGQDAYEMDSFVDARPPSAAGGGGGPTGNASGQPHQQAAAATLGREKSN